jgi:arylsulfatase A-like enzyme
MAPASSPGAFTTLRAALNAGLMAGFVHGGLDGVVAGLGTELHGLKSWLGCLAVSVLVYGAVWVAVLFLFSPLTHGLLRRRDLLGRFRGQLAIALGLALFLELLWWSRPYAFYGVPATDPKRLAFFVVLLVVGLAGGALAVRAGRSLPQSVKLTATVLVPLCWIGGGGYLATVSSAGDERGSVNDRNRDLPNVVLFVVDALRDDVIGAYGSTEVRTPVIDDLAARGVVFENAMVQAPFTWTSFGSILTGKYPRRHGLVKMAPGVRMLPVVTLPWHLKSAPLVSGGRLEDGDYVGASFMTGTLSHGSGLSRGFDVYFEALVGHELVRLDNPWSLFRSELLLSLIRGKVLQQLDAQRVASVAVEWFREHGRQRFFVMVHFYSTHTPYDPPDEFRAMYCDPEYAGPITSFYAEHRQAIEAPGGLDQLTEADRRQIRDLYRAGTTQADSMIGEVLAELERQGVLRNTLVIVTADHGEELGEHDVWEHNWMWQTNLRIPLVMTLPGRIPAASRVSALVETVDIVPTVCGLLGVEGPRPPAGVQDPDPRDLIDGFDLMALVRGETPSVREFSFAENGLFLSIQDRRWKLIVGRDDLDAEAWNRAQAAAPGGRPRLYDLERDPGELHNLIGDEGAQAERLLGALREWDARMPIPRHEIVRSSRDMEHLMRGLGYTEGIGQDIPPERE